MDNEVRLLKSEKVFEGNIVDVVHDTLIMPGGMEVAREVVIRGEASAIVPVTPSGEIVLVRQYRHPTGKYVLEIPAGMLDNGEDPLDCAGRELEEETAYKPGKLKHITSMYSAIGFCTEILHIYLATDLHEGTLNLDEDEFVTTEKYTLDKCIEMIFNGEIVDSKTIVGILAYANSILKYEGADNIE